MIYATKILRWRNIWWVRRYTHL